MSHSRIRLLISIVASVAFFSVSVAGVAPTASAQAAGCTPSITVTDHVELDAAIECYNQAETLFIGLANSIVYPAGSSATAIVVHTETQGLDFSGEGHSVTGGGSAPALTVTTNGPINGSTGIFDVVLNGRGAQNALVIESGVVAIVGRSSIRGATVSVAVDGIGSNVFLDGSIIESSDISVSNTNGASTTISHSTIAGDVQPNGPLAVSNSTINGTLDAGAGVADPGIAISNSTILGQVLASATTTDVVSTIVVGGCSGSALTGTNNLGTGCPGTLGGATGAIGSLADNGCSRPTPTGCPLTALPVPQSLAINQGRHVDVIVEVSAFAGPSFQRDTLPFDQRGSGLIFGSDFQRVNGSAADIGAVEAIVADTRPNLITQDAGGGFLGGAEATDGFGAALAAGDGRLMVGTPGEDGQLGGFAIFNANQLGLSQFPEGAIANRGGTGITETGAAVAAGNFGGSVQFAVGAPGRSVNGAPQAGDVSIYGSSGGQFLTIHADDVGVAGAPEQGDRFGDALAVGDFDNDGRDDLVVGTPGEAIGNRASAGAVSIFYGGQSSAGGLATGRSELIFAGTPGVPGAPEANDEFGAALTAGDFNGDGFDDLAIGAPGEAIGTSRTDAGAVTIIYGSADRLDPSNSEVIFSGTPGIRSLAETDDRFGAALAAGDLNSDGIDDLVIGSPGEALGSRTNAGAVFVVPGSTSGLAPTSSELITGNKPGLPGRGEANDELGAALLVGDYNNDGINDLIIGSPGEAIGTRTNAGAVIIMLGTGGGVSTTVSVLSHGSTPGLPGIAETGDRFGSALALARFDGSLNSLVIGIPGEAIGTRTNAGAIIELAPANF